MDGTPRTHDDLRAAFPGAVSAECDGHGWVNVQLDGEDGIRSARCPACDHDRVVAAISSFIPPRFREPIGIPAEIRDWAAQGRGAEGLYLAGPVGTGKTHAAWRALALWCEVTGTHPRGEGITPYDRRSKPTVIFTRMTDLLDDLRPGDDARQRVRDCQETGLLVLDDLGAEKASEWTQERLYSVIDHRYSACLPLIVTGNLPPGKLAEQTGDRVASRRAEMCQVVPMTGSDRRRAA